MSDYLLVIALTFLWAGTLVLAYGLGWVKGFETSEQKHRWSRWLLHNAINRRTRL